MSVINVVNPAPGAPAGHDAAMVARADAAEAAALAAAGGGAPAAAPPAPAARPDGVPEKFWNAETGTVNTEALLKSYTELEAKASGKPADPAPAPASNKLEVPAADAAADAAVASAGLDMAALRAEFAAEGKLSDASVAALAAKGIGQDAIDAYIAGQQALQAQYDADVMSATPGGAEKYTDMVTWAKANLSDAEINAYNKAVTSGDQAQAKLAVLGLGARFTASVGSEPNLIGGNTNTAPTDIFESTAQVVEAMKDPRYGKDPAYRAQVQAKLGRSQVF